MQMQGSEAVWKLVLDAHLHCVYPGGKRSWFHSGFASAIAEPGDFLAFRPTLQARVRCGSGSQKVQEPTVFFSK